MKIVANILLSNLTVSHLKRSFKICVCSIWRVAPLQVQVYYDSRFLVRDEFDAPVGGVEYHLWYPSTRVTSRRQQRTCPAKSVGSPRTISLDCTLLRKNGTQPFISRRNILGIVRFQKAEIGNVFIRTGASFQEKKLIYAHNYSTCLEQTQSLPRDDVFVRGFQVQFSLAHKLVPHSPAVLNWGEKRTCHQKARSKSSGIYDGKGLASKGSDFCYLLYFNSLSWHVVIARGATQSYYCIFLMRTWTCSRPANLL